MSRIVASTGFVVLALHAGLLGAQDRSERVFSETLEVRVVNLEVVVETREGERVPGLLPEDFELEVDGEPVAIEYFTEVKARALGSSPEGYQGAYATTRGPELETNYLVFVDDYFSLAPHRNRVLRSISEQLDELAAQDRMALVRYDGRETELLQGWTRSKTQLQQALDAATAERARGYQRANEVRGFAGLAEGSVRPLGGQLNELSLEERYVVDRLEAQVERVVAAATSSLRSLGRPSGRKVLMLLSGGWPWDAADYVVDDVTRLIAERRRTAGEVFAPLIDAANLLGYTIYPIDVPGLQATGAGVARDAAFDSNLLRPRSFRQETGLHQSLQHIAAETGGRPFLNAARDRALPLARADTASFYSIGFSAQRAGDDQLHEIEVRVRKPGVRVRSRSSYLDFSRSREVTLAIESALFFGAPPSQAPLKAAVGKAKRAGLRAMNVPLRLGIPVEALTFLPSAEGDVARIELRVAVIDEDGSKADTPVIPLAFRRRAGGDPDASGLVPYETTLKLRRKAQTLVIAIHDLPSGAILSSVIEVEP